MEFSRASRPVHAAEAARAAARPARRSAARGRGESMAVPTNTTIAPRPSSGSRPALPVLPRTRPMSMSATPSTSEHAADGGRLARAARGLEHGALAQRLDRRGSAWRGAPAEAGDDRHQGAHDERHDDRARLDARCRCPGRSAPMALNRAFRPLARPMPPNSPITAAPEADHEASSDAPSRAPGGASAERAQHARARACAGRR